MDETDAEARHLVAALLRDLSNMTVIRAMDRLVTYPSSRLELEQTMQDLDLVKQFVLDACPNDLKGVARNMFMEHVDQVKRHVSASLQGAQA